MIKGFLFIFNIKKKIKKNRYLGFALETKCHAGKVKRKKKKVK